MKNSILCTLILSSTLLTACNDKTDTTISSTAASSSAISNTNVTSNTTVISSTNARSSASSENIPITTDAWLGKWNGPEGTFLEISGGNGSYDITIQNLDGPQKYQGTSTGNQISFERNGTTEVIQASNGADTGTKWLAEKSDCLRVRLGEGWCRD